MGNTSRWARLAMLAAISPSGAIIGGALDERAHLGFTNWRSACRTSGLSFTSLIHFTWELLPNALIGALLGGLVVQLMAFSMRHDASRADDCLAAHFGCAIAMPFGLLLCTLAMPVGLMLAAETALAVAAASGLLVFWQRGRLRGERGSLRVARAHP